MTSQISSAVSSLTEILDPRPDLLAIGEPTHREPAFAHLRNQIFRTLAEHGFRSIVLESDLIAALKVDAYVRDGAGTLDRVMAEGFSHGFGESAANRELVSWMRAYNEGRPATEQVAFHGMDAPLETMSVPSPRSYLLHLHGYLAGHLGADAFLHGRTDLEGLLGDDGRWSDMGALMDPEKSVGGSPEATALRAIADDLVTVLHAQAPGLVAASSLTAWRQAEMHGRAALGLLRYHAQAAEPRTPGARWSRLGGVRDALMAENLLAIRAVERRRGPSLVFAHNLHLQRRPVSMGMGDMDVEFPSVGAILAAVSDPYPFIACSLGTSAELGLGEPAADTYEGALQEATTGSAFFAADRLRDVLTSARTRTDTVPEQGYFPLDADLLQRCDAVLHIAAAT